MKSLAHPPLAAATEAANESANRNLLLHPLPPERERERCVQFLSWYLFVLYHSSLPCLPTV